MPKFIRIATDGHAAALILGVNTNAVVNSKTNELGLSVTLKGAEELPFNYSGDYEAMARAALIPAVFIHCIEDLNNRDQWRGEKIIYTKDIEWFNLSATIGKETGIEIRVATDGLDPAGNQITRQFTGPLASSLYDQLNALAPEIEIGEGAGN